MNQNTQPRRNPKTFKEFLKNFNLINSALLVAAVMAPLIGGKLKDVAPPGYEDPIFLTVFQLAIVIFSFLFFAESSARLLRRVSMIALSLFLCCSIIYFAFLESYTYRLQSSGPRIIRGIEIASEAQRVLEKAECPSTGMLDCALELYGENYGMIWKDYESVSSMRRAILLLVWFLAFLFLVSGVSTFALTL